MDTQELQMRQPDQTATFGELMAGHYWAMTEEQRKELKLAIKRVLKLWSE